MVTVLMTFAAFHQLDGARGSVLLRVADGSGYERADEILEDGGDVAERYRR